jgi:hypothetical protein
MTCGAQQRIAPQTLVPTLYSVEALVLRRARANPSASETSCRFTTERRCPATSCSCESAAGRETMKAGVGRNLKRPLSALTISQLQLLLPLLSSTQRTLTENQILRYGALRPLSAIHAEPLDDFLSESLGFMSLYF